MMIKPNRLKHGDTVGIIAPASSPDDKYIQQAVIYLEGLGLKVKYGKHLDKKQGYLAGGDLERLEDLHSSFADKEIKGIICARGGYGTSRIAHQIDYDLIKRNPKIFLGYSDITYLHTAIRQKCNLITFHGPMVASDMGRKEWDVLSDYYFQQFFRSDDIIYDETISRLKAPISGIAEGPVVGGNLTLLIASLGTPYEIDLHGKLLFIEEVHEEPRMIDRMLNQLLSSGKLEHINGLIIGDFKGCEARDEVSSFSLQEVLHHYIHLINKPTLTGLKIGHCSPNITIPLGTNGEINTEKRFLRIECGTV